MTYFHGSQSLGILECSCQFLSINSLKHFTSFTTGRLCGARGERERERGIECVSTYSRDQKHFQFRSVPLRLVSVPFRNAVDLPPLSDRHVYTYVRNETLIRLMTQYSLVMSAKLLTMLLVNTTNPSEILLVNLHLVIC